jgi:protein TonB
MNFRLRVTIMKIILLVLLGAISFKSLSNELTLVGIGLYKELSADYYYGALYANYAQNIDDILNPFTAKKLVLRITKKRVSARRFYRLWNQTIAINNSEEDLITYAGDILSFTYLLKSRLYRGDEIVIEEVSGITMASVNGHKITSFTQPGFINVLLRGWIGHLPPSSEFKQQVLGLNSSNTDDYLMDFDSLIPSGERTSLVKGWLTDDESDNHLLLSASTPNTLYIEPEIAKIDNVKVVEENNSKIKEQQQLALLVTEKESKAKYERNKLKKLQQDKTRQEHTQKINKRDIRITALKKIQKTQVQYFRQSIAQANKFASYPNVALRRKQEAYIQVRVSVNRQGKVLRSQLLEPSTYPLLNKAALKAISSASPFPPLPKLIDGEQYEITIPFNFKAG